MSHHERPAMKRLLLPGLAALAALFPYLPGQARADVKLPSVIGSHMVLQRDKPLPIWGWADPGEEVTVTLGSASADDKPARTASTRADDKGNWKVTLAAVKADGKAHRLTVRGKNKVVL